MDSSWEKRRGPAKAHWLAFRIEQAAFRELAPHLHRVQRRPAATTGRIAKQSLDAQFVEAR